MWINLNSFSSRFLQCSQILSETKRSTFILRRTRPVRLNKMTALFPKKLKRQQFYYEVVEDTDCVPKPMIELVLIKDVPGVGMLGEKIKADWYAGYQDLLLPKLAVYPNSPLAKNVVRPDNEIKYSSIYSKIVGNYLLEKPLQIFLSQQTKWTLEPWHVKLALRKNGIITKENCITLPEKKISGPDPDVENKDFIVKLTMNDWETFPVRCRIYHWSKVEIDSNALNKNILNSESEPLFPEEKEEIDSLIKMEQEFKESQKFRGKRLIGNNDKIK